MRAAVVMAASCAILSGCDGANVGPDAEQTFEAMRGPALEQYVALLEAVPLNCSPVEDGVARCDVCIVAAGVMESTTFDPDGSPGARNVFVEITPAVGQVRFRQEGRQWTQVGDFQVHTDVHADTRTVRRATADQIDHLGDPSLVTDEAGRKLYLDSMTSKASRDRMLTDADRCRGGNVSGAPPAEPPN